SDVPGTYPIYCAEYCGDSHSMMRGEVVVLAAKDYEDWINGASEGAERGQDLASAGREVAVRRGCVACHTFDGQRHIGPTWSRLYNTWVTLADGRRVRADEAYLTRSMMDPSVE